MMREILLIGSLITVGLAFVPSASADTCPPNGTVYVGSCYESTPDGDSGFWCTHNTYGVYAAGVWTPLYTVTTCGGPGENYLCVAGTIWYSYDNTRAGLC